MKTSRWPLMSLKRLVHRKITDGPHVTPEFLDEGVPFLSVDGIQNNRLVFDNCRRVSASAHQEYTKKCRPRRGDLLFAKAASTGKVAQVDVDFEFSVWSPLALISPAAQHIESRYLFYALISPEAQARIDLLCTFNTQKNVSMGDLENLQVPVPPIETQRQIADFLDSETERIDELVGMKEEFIAQLELKRSALIAAEFIGGTDGQRRTQTILGVLPTSWAIKRLKFITSQITVGIVVTPSKYYVEEGVPCIRSFNVKPMRITDHDLAFISPKSNEMHRKSKIYEGDVVAVRTGQPGTAAVVSEPLSGANCIDLIIIRQPKVIRSELLAYFLNSAAAQSQFAAGANGAIQQHFNIEQAKNILVPIPPDEEQDAMIDRLRSATAALDGLVFKLQEGTAILREYRSALISAAVTGQIDVRTYRQQEAASVCP